MAKNSGYNAKEWTPAEILQKCPLCSSSRIATLYKTKDFISQCRDCGFAFSAFIPTQAELENYYLHYHRYTEVSETLRKRYNQILDFLEPYKKLNQLIEIGCGEGFFLEEAVKRGWNVCGTELASPARDICKSKNISVFESTEDLFKSISGKADVILSLEVMEHLPSPHPEVSRYNELLRNGGAFYLTTPNFNSLSRKILGEDWSVYIYPEHLMYYTPSTINRLFHDHGFRKVKIKTDGISYARVIYSIKMRKNVDSAKAYDFNSVDRNLRNKLDENALLRSAKYTANTILGLTGSGDTLKALFEKK
ncbi:MAG: class I SAM-dependent methyltransferase [Bacteroidia bacterium]